MKLLNIIAGVDRLCQREYLSPAHFYTLLLAYERDGISPTNLSQTCGVTSAAVTGRVRVLRRLGLARITRNLADERRVTVQATDKGAKLIQAFLKECQPETKHQDHGNDPSTTARGAHASA